MRTVVLAGIEAPLRCQPPGVLDVAGGACSSVSWGSVPDQYAPYQPALDRLASTVEHGRMHLDEDSAAASSAFGQRLRELRTQRGLSQDDVARETNVHPTAIGRLERGAREPRLTTILRIARGLHVQPSELVDDLEYL
jgi:DNA-binding XRE family transcriptional regulator